MDRYVRWEILGNNMSWNINVTFVESFLSISEGNECLTGVNTKRNQQAQSKIKAASEDEHSAKNRDENELKAI